MKKKILLLIAVATLGLTAATLAQVPNYVPTNGLVGWWPFNGNANDESGNGYNGTVNGATLTIDRFGNSNSAYSFNGSSNYILVADASALRLSGSDYTISTWINETFLVTTEHQAIISKRNPYTPVVNMDGWLLYIDVLTSPMGKVGIVPAGYPNTCAYTSAAVTLNNWINIIEVYHSGTQTIETYKNGVLNNTTTGISSPNNTTTLPLYIGSDKESNSYFFNGKIDDIGIWNRALTQQEITNLYNGVICGNNTNISPQNNSLATGSIATFNATTSDPNPNYVWQSDFGQGFQTLNNFGNYSGANTNTLYIGNLQLHNHMQPIRVISTSGNCIDTSNVATISITDTCINTINDTNYISVTDTLIINTAVTGINPPNNLNTIRIFPNPASTHITIDYGNFSIMNGYQLKITNSLGQQMFQTAINQQSNYVSLASWGGNGLYFVYIIDPQGNTLDIRKIVLQ